MTLKSKNYLLGVLLGAIVGGIAGGIGAVIAVYTLVAMSNWTIL